MDLRQITLASLVWIAAASSLWAAPMRFTYDWSASNILDSNGNPPPNGLLTTSGTFTLDFDPEASPGLIDIPIVSSTSFTDNEGVTLTEDDIFSIVEVQTAVPQRTYRIVVGSIVSPLDSAETSVGDTNDFFLQFLVAGGTGLDMGEPLANNPFQVAYTSSNGDLASVEGDLSVNLVSVSAIPAPQPIPLPAGAVLLLSGLGLAGWAARRRR